METFDLGTYMSGSIRNIMTKAYKNVLLNPREAKFAFRMQTLFQKSDKRRQQVREEHDIDVPPFLISSIATTCNLHCKGCYARSNGIAEDEASDRKETLSPQQWHDIFMESSTSVLMALQNHARSRLSATATWQKWGCVKLSSRLCSARFVLPKHWAGSTQAVAPSLNIGKR